jgi:death-on-curing family protein
MPMLIQNHLFVDGNKRTGIATAAILLQVNGFRLITTNPEIETITLSFTREKQDVPGIAF